MHVGEEASVAILMGFFVYTFFGGEFKAFLK